MVMSGFSKVPFPFSSLLFLELKVIDVTGSAGLLKDGSPRPVLLHLASKTAFVQGFYFHVSCIFIFC